MVRAWRRVRLVVVGLCLLAVPPRSVAAQEVVEYYALDALGSVRVVFDASGNVIGRMDYDPFGAPLAPGVNLSSRAYAGLFRDGEAGLDFAQARSYQGRTGRFSTVDRIDAGLFAPQAWNRYAYASNQPITGADPSGLCDTNLCFEVTVRGSLSYVDLFWKYAGQGAYGAGSSSGRDMGLSGSNAGSRNGGQSSTKPSATPDEPDENNDSRNGGGPDSGATQLTTELLQGCGAGALAFVDGAIPFADPLASLGAYNPGMPGIGFSQQTGAVVSGFAAFEVSAGALLARGATWLATAGRAGNSLARTASSGNRYLRLGVSNMGGGAKTPALRFGNATSEWGRWLTHVDLRVTQVFSATAPKQVKRAQQCLRMGR